MTLSPTPAPTAPTAIVIAAPTTAAPWRTTGSPTIAVVVIVDPADASRAAVGSEDSGTPLWIFILIAAAAVIICVVGGVLHRRRKQSAAAGSIIAESVQASRSMALVNNPVYASVAPIDTIAVDGNSVAVQKPTPAHGDLGLDVDEYYSTMGPASNDHGMAMQNPVYAPPATVAGNPAYDTAESHYQTVSNAAQSRPLYSQPAITDQSDNYECFFVDDGTSETPPGAINASTAQKEGKASVGNAGTAYAMPLPVPDNAYATVSDTERYSMPISQDEGAYSMPLSSQMVSSDDAFSAYSMSLSQDAASAGTSSSAGRNAYNDPWIHEFETTGEISI